jgi:hypothetical protein
LIYLFIIFRHVQRSSRLLREAQLLTDVKRRNSLIFAPSNGSIEPLGRPSVKPTGTRVSNCTIAPALAFLSYDASQQNPLIA